MSAYSLMLTGCLLPNDGYFHGIRAHRLIKSLAIALSISAVLPCVSAANSANDAPIITAAYQAPISTIDVVYFTQKDPEYSRDVPNPTYFVTAGDDALPRDQQYAEVLNQVLRDKGMHVLELGGPPAHFPPGTPTTTRLVILKSTVKDTFIAIEINIYQIQANFGDPKSIRALLNVGWRGVLGLDKPTFDYYTFEVLSRFMELHALRSQDQTMETWTLSGPR